MTSLGEYLKNPCGTLSIPYWKNKTIRIPSNMRIVHQRAFTETELQRYTDDPYFRLMHDLKDIGLVGCGMYVARTAAEDDLPLMVELINRSYDDLSVTLEQMHGYRRTAVFAEELWIIASDAETLAPVGCGIADFDPEAKEGILEWIQVLPEHRGRKAGRFVVTELLRRMADRAAFATVSGRINNVTSPEMLYRKCGFTGNDVWHILMEK